MNPSDEYNEFAKNHIGNDKNAYAKKNLRKIAYDFIKLKTGEKAKDDKCYWLVFRIDDCNTYYSDLIYCGSKEEAVTILSVLEGIDAEELDARKMTLKNIDTMAEYFEWETQ